MFKVPQKVELYYAGHKLWLNVWRYDTPTELQTALSKAAVRDFDSKTVAYTHIVKKGDKCGDIHLLDTSIEALAREASKMAFGISARVGNNELDADFESDHSNMTAFIVSELYSKNKYF